MQTSATELFDPMQGAALIDAIEQWRSQFRADTQLLADGSLDQPGPFDDGETVARAVHASRGRRGGDFLHLLTLLHRPRKVLELGTGLGISTAYIAGAMRLAGDGGTLHSIDASPYRHRLARRMFDALGLAGIVLHTGRFADVLPELLQHESGFDMVFVDAQHDHRNTNRLHDLLRPHLAPRALVLQNGVEVSEGMRAAWGHMRAARNGAASATDVNGLGVALLHIRPEVAP